MSTVPLVFAVFTAVYAYLAINTPEEHGALQTGHYLLTHLGIFFTGFLSYAFTKDGETPADLILGWATAYQAVLVLVFMYFAIMIIDRVFGEGQQTSGGQ